MYQVVRWVYKSNQWKDSENFEKHGPGGVPSLYAAVRLFNSLPTMPDKKSTLL